MSDNSAPGNGVGDGRPDPEVPAGMAGPVGRRTDVMSRRRLAWKIWAGTGTIIATAAAGLIVYEFGHGILAGVLTSVIVVAVGMITGLIIYNPPKLHRRIGPRDGMPPKERRVTAAARQSLPMTRESLKPPRSRPMAAG